MAGREHKTRWRGRRQPTALGKLRENLRRIASGLNWEKEDSKNQLSLVASATRRKYLRGRERLEGLMNPIRPRPQDGNVQNST
jgi:hypothetical protein